MVLNKIAVAALMADMVTSFTGLFSVSQYVDYVILGCWFYVAAMAAVSVAVKMTRHREELVFRLYILFPVYYYGGQKGSGALTWLEQHTGISMRSLWSLKFIKMILPSCAMAVLLLVWLSTCVVQVETYQQGALYRFGSLAREDILEPGLHFKLPVPFEEVKIYNVTQPQGMIVGYEGDVNNKNNLWTRPHEGEEQALLLGNGNELVAINLKITYRISDLYTYLTRYSSPEDVLNAKGYEVVMGETIHTDINTCLLYTSTDIENEVTVLQGEEEGPTIYIVAGVHGDEIAGWMTGNLVKKIGIRAGTVHILSPANRWGAEADPRVRYVTEQEDLNRSFPGDPEGNMAQRVADSIYQDIQRVDPVFLFDLHEARANAENKDFLGSSLIYTDLSEMSDMYLEMLMATESGDCLLYTSTG